MGGYYSLTTKQLWADELAFYDKTGKTQTA
jgi:hypothetical protein